MTRFINFDGQKTVTNSLVENVKEMSKLAKNSSYAIIIGGKKLY